MIPHIWLLLCLTLFIADLEALEKGQALATKKPVSNEITDDTLLGGRISLSQPSSGYRAAIDPVLLAASVPAKAGELVLDLGCGVGAVMLCLSARVAGVRVDGLELQPQLSELAAHNIRANGLEDRVRVYCGNLLVPPVELIEAGGRAYDHVIANPPYQTQSSGHPPPDASKRTAHVEGEAGLAAWVREAGQCVRRKGRVTFIHHAERLSELLAALETLKGEQAVGDITIVPLLAHAGEAASRVIVSWRRGVKTPLRLLAGIVLHEADGAYTPDVKAALEGAALRVDHGPVEP